MKRPDRHRGAAALLGCALFALVGCGESEDLFGAGFDAGYAAGYETSCELTEAPLRTDFDDDAYARGYAAGVESGRSRCERDRRAGRLR